MSIDGIPRMSSYKRPAALSNLGGVLNTKAQEIGGSKEVRGGLAGLFSFKDDLNPVLPPEKNINKGKGESGPRAPLAEEKEKKEKIV
ncbi:hypothetical protein A2276_05665 [candidate division WOR-1 bacterium RIFOXYA12_FULL_43_27]|uniref:Uncharacterized protein n=1 Tax=candidate division WOR-1 bacterium RIFOXYC2_FULL_46_14 TaxID=1802587 RepID=A0A1F4U3P9_UNCSA|nr:MAG: hypothetical protein A2276_05665 [candidate division WOR-1 bacterium RIFOXYA12_FULL_43_27]OGC20153.1 MAG: hypothetical protein A2292_03670 [candidate division WOR-1 bacterium RIFOXYB2_FULL_46_45]OGC32110.1 MAG: hypothetical protein A2232_07780 [candidate division WOR-1 bacterium RIFOXYA2_FULL_46_56]OGC39511.1 MAG: hypothetical protein A2438_08140 [candidate division WOR-1 bacterium RIFOXYC2_FULL_46_14]